MSDEIIFWGDFFREAPELTSLVRSGHEQIAFAKIDALLDRFRLPFCFDITCDDYSCYFILSPEGDRETAEQIDNLVRVAPDIPDWKIYPRRPRKTLEDACAIVRQLYLIDPRSARFLITKSDKLKFVQMYVSTGIDLDEDEKKGLINTFLWHAIGEDLVMSEHIKGEVITAISPSGKTITASDLVERLAEQK